MNNLFSTSKGSGENSIVFLHGLWGGGNYFRDLSLVPTDYHQYFPDELGFGKSPKPHTNYTPQLHCSLIEKLLPQKNKIVLLGHSFGGTLALNFASLYPNRVKKLILVSPLIYKNEQDAKKYLYSNFITKLTIKHPLAAKFLCNSFCNTGILGKISPFFVSKNRKEYIGGCTEHTWQSYYSTFTNCILNNPVAETTTSLAKNIPISIIYGDSDSYIDYSIIDHLSTPKTLIPQSDHYVLFEKFEKCKQVIAQYLKNP